MEVDDHIRRGGCRGRSGADVRCTCLVVQTHKETVLKLKLFHVVYSFQSSTEDSLSLYVYCCCVLRVHLQNKITVKNQLVEGERHRGFIQDFSLGDNNNYYYYYNDNNNSNNNDDNNNNNSNNNSKC